MSGARRSIGTSNASGREATTSRFPFSTRRAIPIARQFSFVVRLSCCRRRRCAPSAPAWRAGPDWRGAGGPPVLRGRGRRHRRAGGGRLRALLVGAAGFGRRAAISASSIRSKSFICSLIAAAFWSASLRPPWCWGRVRLGVGVSGAGAGFAETADSGAGRGSPGASSLLKRLSARLRQASAGRMGGRACSRQAA